MTSQVFVNALGAYLPGEPLDNEAIEGRLGMIFGKPSRAKARVLKNNKILTRHYALDEHGKTLESNHGMAAKACRQALARAVEASPVLAAPEYIACATSLDDLFLPGFASMVHGALKTGPLISWTVKSSGSIKCLPSKTSGSMIWSAAGRTILNFIPFRGDWPTNFSRGLPLEWFLVTREW